MYGCVQKNDIEMVYTKNGVTYSIGGTIKLRQGEKDLNGKGWIKNIHSGLTLGRLVELTLENTGQSQLGQYYAACLGAIKTTQSNRSRFFDTRSSDYMQGLLSWENMKQAATLSGIALGLSGSGNYGDFSGILIYNNIIYSIYDLLLKEFIMKKSYDLLEKALYYDKNGVANIAGSITPSILFTAEKFNSTHKRILDASKTLNKQIKNNGLPFVIGQRQAITAKEIQSLWNTKVEINFNLAKLVF